MTRNERKQRKQAMELERNQEKKAGNFLSRLITFSIILHYFDAFTNTVYKWIVNGFFGRIFTAYQKEQRAFESGYVKGYFTERGSGFLRRARAKLSGGFEGSYLLSLFSKVVKKLLRKPLKAYGTVLLSFGIYSLAAYFAKQIITRTFALDGLLLATSIVCIVASFPLHLSKESLGVALKRGRITRIIIIEAFGFSDQELDFEADRTRRRINFAIIIGMVPGLLAFVVQPIYIILASLLVLLSVLILCAPEIGVVLGIFALPFFSLLSNPSVALTMLVLVTAFGYAVKVLRGKRILKFEIIDIFVVLFAVLLLMSGIISAGGASSMLSAGMCCVFMLVYFVIVNTMRTPEWINRCVNALVGSGVLVAAYGVYQFIAGNARLEWLDTGYFTSIQGRVVSLFSNPNMLSSYLVIVFPFLLSKLFKAKTGKGWLLAFISVITVVACAVLTYSRSAWIAMIATFVIYGLIHSKKALKALISMAFVIPFISFLLPKSIVERFLSIGDISESSNFYRVYTWRGSFDLIKDYFFGGIGFGNDAYSEIYPQYAYAGIEAAKHSHSLYLQIMISMGVFGLLVFATVIFLFAQKNLEFFKNNRDSSLFAYASSAFLAVVGVLIVGLFDYPWYNYRIFYLFWVVFAIACACVRTGDRESQKRKMVNAMGADSASIDI